MSGTEKNRERTDKTAGRQTDTAALCCGEMCVGVIVCHTKTHPKHTVPKQTAHTHLIYHRTLRKTGLLGKENEKERHTKTEREGERGWVVLKGFVMGKSSMEFEETSAFTGFRNVVNIKYIKLCMCLFV